MDLDRRGFLAAVSTAVVCGTAGCGGSTDGGLGNRTDRIAGTGTRDRPSPTEMQTPHPTRTPFSTGECGPVEPTESTLRDGTVRIVGGEAVVDRSPSVDVPFEVTNLGKTTVRPTDLAIESNVDDVSCLSRTGSDALYGTWSDEGDGIVWRSDYPLDPEETLRVELPVRAHCGSFGSVDFGGATGVVVDPPLPCDRAVRVRLTVGERIEVYDADVPDMVDGSEYVSSDRIAFLYGVRNVGQSDVEPHVTVYAPEWWRRGSVLHDEFETIAPGQEEEGQTTRSVAWLDRTREGWFGATVRDAITDRVLAHRRTHKVLQRTG